MKKFNWTPVLLMVAGAILWAIIRRVFLKIFRKKEKQPSVEVAPSVTLPTVEVKEVEKAPIGFQPEKLVKEEADDSVKVENS